ncbi:MAG: glycosyltransferase family 2 protein [Pseudomonadota bacterium]
MPPRTAVILPCLGMQPALDALLAALPAGLDVFVVDDGSPVPLGAARGTLLRHPANRGYGAAQKSGYAAALRAGAERLVLLHGDGQYDVAATLALAETLDGADAAVGTRFDERLVQRVPAWRSLGIHGLTMAANLRFGQHFTDLHNGARAFRAEVIAALDVDRFSDDYRFDHQVLSALIAGGARVVQRPVPMRYGPEVLSISPRRALRYGLGCLLDLARPPVNEKS